MKPATGHLREWISLDAWARDLRYAARSLWRAPAFSIAVFCSLVVCLGPNAAILSALYALILKPLPFPEPGQLVTVVNVAEKNTGQALPSSLAQYADFKARADLFTGFAAVRHSAGLLEEGDAPVRVAKTLATPDFFTVLGVKPLQGRFFTHDEATEGSDNVVVLSQDFWESRYRADPDVVGQQVRLDGKLCTIVGVAPRSLSSLRQQTCFFQPYAAPASRLDAQLRYRGDVTVHARLKTGVALSAGLAQLAALERGFQVNQAPASLKEYISRAGFQVVLEPLRAGEVTGGKANALWLIQGSAFLVLLIGGVNAMNLFFARMNARRAELSVRVALGAARPALLRPLLAESFLLTGAATLAAVGFSLGAVRVFNRYLPLIAPSAPPVTLDVTVMGVIAVVAVSFALLAGLLPLRLMARDSLGLGGGRAASASRGARAATALLLAAIGLYGVLSYDVSQRTREIGIRGAVGATRGQIVGLVMQQGLTKAGLGLAAGLLGAFFLTHALDGLLFGVEAADPVSYLAGLGALAGVSLLACWLPARRAATVDPIIALRAE